MHRCQSRGPSCCTACSQLWQERLTGGTTGQRCITRFKLRHARAVDSKMRLHALCQCRLVSAGKLSAFQACALWLSNWGWGGTVAADSRPAALAPVDRVAEGMWSGPGPFETSRRTRNKTREGRIQYVRDRYAGAHALGQLLRNALEGLSCAEQGATSLVNRRRVVLPSPSQDPLG